MKINKTALKCAFLSLLIVTPLCAKISAVIYAVWLIAVFVFYTAAEVVGFISRENDDLVSGIVGSFNFNLRELSDKVNTMSLTIEQIEKHINKGIKK